ncbi:MAG TPA: carboxypeptidase-like regulatory domain-containing protein [Thermoanaerobaculia bacterium]
MTTENDTLPGNLDGTVVDEQGSTLPGVVLTLLGNPFPLVQVSNSLGEFRFLSLQAGSYTLSAQLEGFAPAEYPVVINSGQTTDIEVTLSAVIQG